MLWAGDGYKGFVGISSTQNRKRRHKLERGGQDDQERKMYEVMEAKAHRARQEEMAMVRCTSDSPWMVMAPFFSMRK